MFALEAVDVLLLLPLRRLRGLQLCLLVALGPCSRGTPSQSTRRSKVSPRQSISSVQSHFAAARAYGKHEVAAFEIGEVTRSTGQGTAAGLRQHNSEESPSPCTDRPERMLPMCSCSRTSCTYLRTAAPGLPSAHQSSPSADPRTLFDSLERKAPASFEQDPAMSIAPRIQVVQTPAFTRSDAAQDGNRTWPHVAGRMCEGRAHLSGPWEAAAALPCPYAASSCAWVPWASGAAPATAHWHISLL